MKYGINILYYSLVRPRWRKVLSDLWGNKIRTLLVILSIAVGVFAVGMIMTIYVVLSEDMKVSYAAINPANVFLTTQAYNIEFVDTLENVKGVKDVMGAWKFTTRARSNDSDWTAIDITGLRNPEKMGVNRVTLLEGTWPPADKQIVVDQYRLNKLQARLGDIIEVELPSGAIRQMPLVGIIQDQSIGSEGLGGFFVASPQGYVTYETLTWLEQPEKFNKVYATVADGQNDEEHIRQVANALGDEFHHIRNQVSSSVARKTTDHPNTIYIDAIAGLLFLLGFFVLFLSAFLITNTLQALLNQQAQQIGVMKTFGGRNLQIVIIYMALIAGFSLAALAIALPLTGQISFVILDFLARQINFRLQGFRIVPAADILQIAIALIVPQAAGIFPILRGARVAVQEALNNMSQDKETGSSFFDRWVENIRGLPRPLLLSFRNTFRHKIRLLLTLVTLMLGGAIFIATINVRVSLDQYIDRLSKYFTADVSLTMEKLYRIEEIQQVVSQVPGVQVVEGWASASGELVLVDGSDGDNVEILAPPANSPLLEPMIISGRWLVPDDQNAIAVNERFIERFPNLRVGDTLELKVNDKKYQWVVIGFFQFAGKSGGYIAYANYDYLSKIIHTSNQAYLYRISSSGAHSAESQLELSRQIETHMKRLGYQVLDVRAGASLSDSASQGLNVLTAFLMFLAALTASVGSIGLAGTMSMNVLERTREIGIMRTIGASDRTITTLVLVEGLIIGLISWLAGSALAIPISRWMADIVSYSLFSSPAIFTFSFYTFGIWLAVIVVLSAVACVMPARNAARLTIREVLAYE